MKIQTIPAQITTIQDTIVGTLTFTQLLLLMFPVFWGMILYSLLPPQMDISSTKLLLFFGISFTFILLALRIKEKLLLEWIRIFLAYYLRPTYYVFDKNDTYLRPFLPVVLQPKKPVVLRENMQEDTSSKGVTQGSIIRFEYLLQNQHYSFSVKAQKKGGLYVAIEQKN